MRSRFLVGAAALLALAACGGPDETATGTVAGPGPAEGVLAGDAPHVLLITLDTTRADHVGFASVPGEARASTPHLDRLAERSAVFTRAMAQSAVTPVSHASILTGLDPYHHGLRRLHGTHAVRLAEERLTLAEILRSLGYETAAFVSAFPAGSAFGLDQGFQVFDEDFLVDSPDEIVNEIGFVTTGANQRTARATTDLALDWLNGTDGRVFLWLHYFDPHDPELMPPQDFTPRAGEAEAMASPDLARSSKAAYAYEVRFMDQEIGRLLDQIAGSERAGRFLVVVVADHGQGLGDHDWWTHDKLYDEQIRVPLLVHLPEGHPLAGPPSAGRRIETQVRTTDVLPTVLDVLGVPVGELPTDGRSLLPLLEPGAEGEARTAYADALSIGAYLPGNGMPHEVKSDVLLMVSDGRWKYIHHAMRPEESELYDLADDPRESMNVLPEHPEVVQRLGRDLFARDPYRGMDRSAGGEGTSGASEPSQELTEEERERLEALGYLVADPAAGPPD